jgi:hypothetical protein
VHRSSETSTNQSDVIIRSDDRFLNLVVDSDSIVSKILFNFVLWQQFYYDLQHFQSAYLSVKSTLGQNCQMSVRMRAKKKAGIKLQYFCQYRDRKKTNQRTKLNNILDTIESESTTRFKNRSSDRMMTSD